jgi:hypothetical protein
MSAKSCLRCGNPSISVEEWYCGDNPKPYFRCQCANGHAWDEWAKTKDEAIDAWNAAREDMPDPEAVRALVSVGKNALEIYHAINVVYPGSIGTFDIDELRTALAPWKEAKHE